MEEKFGLSLALVAGWEGSYPRTDNMPNGLIFFKVGGKNVKEFLDGP